MTRLVALSGLLWIVPSLALLGCSSAGRDTQSSEAQSAQTGEQEEPQRLTSIQPVYRVRSTHVPDWVLRVERVGDAIKGHAVRYVSVRESSNAREGSVTGTVDANGNVRLDIVAPEPWSPTDSPRVAHFAGVITPVGLDGTIEYAGVNEPASMSAVRRGATDDTGSPFASTLRASPPAACTVDVGTAEFFSLANAPLEARLNEIFRKAVKGAPEQCTVGVDAVSGGARVTLLKSDLVSVANVYTVLRIDDYVQVARPERHTFDLTKGDELALFGDVVTPGADSALLDVLNASIDRIVPDVLSDPDRAALKSFVSAALADGRLGQRWGLVDEGVVFDVAPDFEHPRITGIRAAWADLRPILAPNGRARSAWIER